jgi:predicted ABC-type ATPase
MGKSSIIDAPEGYIPIYEETDGNYRLVNKDEAQKPKILDILKDNAIGTEGLLPGQTPLRDENLSIGGRETSKFKDTVHGIPIDWKAWASAPEDRKNFYFVSPDKVGLAIRRQYKNYITNPRGYKMTEDSTLEDVVKKFDQENPENKIKGLEDQGINVKTKIKDLKNSFDLSSLNPFSVKEANADEVPDLPPGYETVQSADAPEGYENIPDGEDEGIDVGEKEQKQNIIQQGLDKLGKALMGIKILGSDITAGEAMKARGKSDLDKVVAELPEVTVKNIKKSFKRGVVSAEISQASYLALIKKLDYKKDVKPLREQQRKVIESDPIKGKNNLSQAIYDVSEMSPNMGAGILEGAATGAIAGGTAALTGVGAPAALPLFIAGQTVGSLNYWYRQGAGDLYADLMDKEIPENIAQPIAHIAGALYGAVEFSQVEKLIPGSKEMSKRLLSDSLQKTIGKMVFKYGVAWAQEVGEEGIQQIIMTTADEVSSKVAGVSGKGNKEIIKKVLVDGWEATKQSALPMLLLMAPGAAVDVKNLSDEEKIKKMVREENARRIVQTTQEEIKKEEFLKAGEKETIVKDKEVKPMVVGDKSTETAPAPKMTIGEMEEITPEQEESWYENEGIEYGNLSERASEIEKQLKIKSNPNLKKELGDIYKKQGELEEQFIQRNKEVSDVSPDIQGVESGIEKGKEPIKAEPVEGTSGEEIKTSGIFQTSKEAQEVTQPTEGKVLYRGGSASEMPKGMTAEDVIKYEQEELGNKDVVVEPGVDVSKIKSDDLAWLTETKSQAEEYGEAAPSDIKNYRIIARDSDGGVLIEKLKKPTEGKVNPAQKFLAENPQGTVEEFVKSQKIVYHVVDSDVVPSVMKEGVVPNKGSIAKNVMGGNLSEKGKTYAFENFDDAARWAFRNEYGKGKKQVILQIGENPSNYEQDTHFESQGAKGKWLKKKGGIPASNIIDSVELTPEMTKRLVLNAENDAKGALTWNEAKPKSSLLSQFNEAKAKRAAEGKVQPKSVEDVKRIVEKKKFVDIGGFKVSKETNDKINSAREKSLSLPETLDIETPERLKLREDILNKLYGNGAKKKEKRIDIVFGLPASGKSSQVSKYLVEEHGSLVVDADDAKLLLPEYNNGIGANATHKESGVIADTMLLPKAISAGDNIVYSVLGKNLKKFESLIEELNNKGYGVHLHYVDLPVNKAVGRVIERFEGTGRFVDPEYIVTVGLTPSKNYDILKMQKGVESYEKLSTDVGRGERATVIERSGRSSDGISDNRAEATESAGKTRIGKIISFFDRTLAKEGILPRNPIELRTLVQNEVGGDPKQYYDEIYDALEMSINKQLQKELIALGTDATLKEKMKIAQRIEESLPLRSRSLETIKMQQFSTPLPLAVAANHLLGIQPGDVVLEPTAGTGNLIIPFLDGSYTVIANELDARRLEVLRNSGTDIQITDQDFLKYDGPSPNKIIANPPFGALSRGKYQGFAADFTPSNIDQRFIAKMLRLLPEGGRAVVVTSEGTGTGSSGNDFRKWLRKEHTLVSIITSPVGIYKHRGSPTIGTTMFVIDKGKISEEIESEKTMPLAMGSESFSTSEKAPQDFDSFVAQVDKVSKRKPIATRPKSAILKSGGKENVLQNPTTPSANRPSAGGSAGISTQGSQRVGSIEPIGTVGHGPASVSAQQPESRGGVKDDIGSGTSTGRVEEPERRSDRPTNRKRIGHFVEYQRNNTLPVVNPHPSVIVESQELSSVNPPKIIYTPGPRLLQSYKDKNISDQAMDVVLTALQSVSKGKGFLIADDVGVGKTREMAGIILDALDTGKANRVLYVTISDPVLEAHIKGDFSIVMTGSSGNPLPFNTVRLDAIKNIAKQESLPVQNKALYTVTRDKFKRGHENILKLDFDLIVFDEAHQWRPENEKQAKAIAWRKIHNSMYGKPMIYATATPGIDLSDLKYLYGLGEWTEETFDNYLSNISGEAVKKRGMFSGGSSFNVGANIPLTQQFMRELKMKGLYASRDLSRENVGFSSDKLDFNEQDIEAYDAYTKFLLKAYKTGAKFAKFNKIKGARALGLLKSMMQNAAKRHQVDLKIQRTIPLIEQSIKEGKRVFLFTSGLNELDPDAPMGYLRAVINAINEDAAEMIEGEVITDKIPEAIEAKMLLLEELQGFPEQLSIEKFVKEQFGKKYKVGYYTGNVTESMKRKYLKEWMEGKLDIILGSDAAKTAISAHDIIGRKIQNYYLDVDFETVKFKQALGRTNRAGEKTSPDISIPNIGAAGEHKFISTIAVRMKSLGATSKGQAESGAVDFLSEFDLEGSIANLAARNAYTRINDSDKELFLNEKLWEYGPDAGLRPRRVAPNTFIVDNFLFDLNFMPYEDGNRMFAKLMEEYKSIVEAGSELSALRAERQEGEILKETSLYKNPDDDTDYVNLTEVTNNLGEHFGIVTGRLLDKADKFSEYGQRRFVKFNAPGQTISGLKILPSYLSDLANSFGVNIASSITKDNAFRVIMSGDKVPVIGGMSLYLRQDKTIGIKGAKMSEKNSLLKAGAGFNPVGSAWVIKDATEENLRKFLLSYPLAQQSTKQSAPLKKDYIEKVSVIRGGEEATITYDYAKQEKEMNGVKSFLSVEDYEKQKAGTIQRGKEQDFPVSVTRIGISDVERDIQKEGTTDTDYAYTFPPLPQSSKKPVNDNVSGVSFSDPEIEQRFKESKGIDQTPGGLKQRVSDFLDSFWKRATRVYPELPNDPKFASIRNTLGKVANAKMVSKDRALRNIDAITAGFGPKKLDLFTRKVILDDLMAEAQANRALPFGYSQMIDGRIVTDMDTLQQDFDKINSIVGQNADVKNAVEMRAKLWEAITSELVRYDILKEEQIKSGYFRHQILEYANAKSQFQPGKKLKKPRPGYAKRRGGSTFDINTDYLQVETEIMAQTLNDIEMAKALESIEAGPLNIAPRLKAEAKELKKETGEDTSWQELLPDGYVLWQPEKGNVFFSATSIPEKIIGEILTNETAEISAEDLKKVLAIGRKKKQLALPEEVAKTLDRLYEQKNPNFITESARTLTTSWKKWVLLNPRRAFKYNLQNFVGDFDALVAGDPRALKYFGQSNQELTDVFYKHKPMTQDMRDFFERGGFSSQLTFQEIPSINQLEMFNRFMEKENVSDKINFAKKYWNIVTVLTNYRETIMRYSAYLHYKKLIETGQLKNYAASNKAEIDALTNSKDKAAKLATELLGDYANISALGKDLRETTIPFYSWLEVNIKRYNRLFRNAFNEGVGPGARVTGVLAAKGGVFLAKFMLRAVALTALVALYNNTRFPEEEKELSEYDKNRMHLIIGRDENGRIQLVRAQGAFSDLIEWMGLDSAPQLWKEYFEGKASLADIFGKIPYTDMPAFGLNPFEGKVGIHPAAMKFLRGINPLYKLPVETMTGKSLPVFDDASWKIDDKVRNILKAISLENEYDFFTKKPSRGYINSLQSAFITAQDPMENAYRYIQGEKYKFLETVKGRGGSGDYYSPRSLLIREYKKALAYNDDAAIQRAKEKLKDFGVTKKEISDAMKYADPESGLSKADRKEFENHYLSQYDREKFLSKAKIYYQKTFKKRGTSEYNEQE